MITRFAQWKHRSAQAGRPTGAHFELTYRCNLRCRHCFQDRHAARDEMTLTDWMRTVDELRNAGVLIITVSGGEAMLSPHFWPLLEHIRSRGLAFRVFTNGMLLTREACKRFVLLRPASVEVSIFSLNPALHDGVTGAPGSLHRAVKGLFRLHRLGVRTKVKSPLLDQSGADFQRVRALAEWLGASVVFDPGITPRFDGGLAPTACRGDDELLLEYFSDPKTQLTGFTRVEPRGPGDPICGIARTFTVIAPDGRVLPCTHVQQAVGNVRHSSWTETWTGSPVLQALRRTTYGDLPVCGSCAKSGYCGRCSAVAMLEDGDFHGPSSRACKVAEIKERAWGLPSLPVPPRVTTGTSARLRVLA
jgi:radical SAM protein with 4Fe4S-binding SPASM domain